MDALLVLWWKAAVVLAAGGAAAVVAWRASAATRHLIWTAALAGALLLPAAIVVLPSVRVVALPARRAKPVPSVARMPVPVAPVRAVVARPPTVSEALVPAAPLKRVRRPIDWRRVAPFVWLAGALALLLRIAAGSLQLRAMGRRAVEIVDPAWRRLLVESAACLGVRGEVTLLESAEIEVPATWGSLRPVVVLPPAASRWSDAQKRAVLVHELAHVARRDAATQLVARVACAVHWVNPLAWAAAAAMRAERERACDDSVLEAGARPTDYATNLLDVARAALRDGAPATALAMARRSQLEGRLLAVLDPRRDRRPLSARRAMGVACGAACLVLPLAAVRAERARAPEPVMATVPEPEPAVAPEPLPTPSPVRRARRAVAQSSVSVSSSSGDVYAPVPPTPPSAPTPPTPPTPPSPPSAPSGNFSQHIVSNDGSRVWTVSWSDDQRAVEISARGEVRWNDDATDVASIGSGGSLQVSVHERGHLTHAEIQPASGGLRRTLLADGDQRPWDPAWFSALLRDLDRHTGFAAEARFPRLYREQGARGVLEQAGKLQSDYALRRYLSLLIEADPMQESTAIAVVESASRMHGDYDRAEILKAVAARARLDSDAAREAFLRACNGISGDYEHARVLHVLADQSTLSPALTRGVLESASTIRGDYEKSGLLIALAGRHPVDPSEYLRAASTLSGDYERSRSLKALIAAQRLPESSQVDLIRQAARLGDYESAEVLLALAAKQPPSGEALREYESAARRLGDYSRQRVLAALHK
ncbi:MAG: M56 family metallopeptidase [Myxococcales bacterium]